MKKTINKKKTLRKKILISLAPGQMQEPMVYASAINHCRQLSSDGNHPMAAFIAEQLTTAVPGDLEPQLLLLTAAIQLMQMDQAELLAAGLLEQFPRSDQVHKTVADYHIAIGDPEAAIPLLQKAIKLKPNQASHHNAIGNLHLFRGETQQALKSLDRAISLEPAYVGAHFNRAQLVRNKTEPKIIERLNKMATSGKIGGRPLALVYFSLAWCYGEDQKALHFKYLDKANEQMSSVLNTDIDGEMERLRSSLEFDAKQLAQPLSGKGNVAEAPIFICAMPRSGTTVLEQILGAHSKTCPIGETGALMSAANTIGQRIGKTGTFWEWGNEKTLSQCLSSIDHLFLSSPFMKKVAGRRVIDKSINNIVVAGLIPLIYPNARIIHLARNPMAVSLSCYQQYFEYGQNFIYKLRDIARTHQLYGEIMNHWEMQFPDNVIQVNYESLVTEPETETKRLLDFCDLPWEENCLRYHESPQTIRTASYLQARKPISTSSIDRWKAYEEYLRPAAEELGLI